MEILHLTLGGKVELPGNISNTSNLRKCTSGSIETWPISILFHTILA
jgi:hypothetical protein